MLRWNFFSRLLCSTAALLSVTNSQAARAADTAVESVVVNASRSSDVALQQQRNALNIVNVQSAEKMAQYPDYRQEPDQCATALLRARRESAPAAGILSLHSGVGPEGQAVEMRGRRSDTICQ
jgi:hypothetical protein